MKKLLALALAIVMMFAIALPAFATHYGEGNDDSDSTNYLTDAADVQNDKTTVLTYGVAQAYIVSIPATLQLHEAHDTADGKVVGYVYNNYTIAVSDVVVMGNEELNIYVKGNATGSFKLSDADKTTNKNADVDYYVTLDEYYGFAEDEESLVPGESGLGSLVLNCPVKAGNQGTTGNATSANIFFSSKGTAQEGVYVDTLTFTVKVEADTTVA